MWTTKVIAAATILLLGVCAAFVVAAAEPPSLQLRHPYHLTGKVYCDTCACGFETTVTNYIPGAGVKLECKTPDDEAKIVFSVTNRTDSTGTYHFSVLFDHVDQICDVALVSSPWPHCNKADPGRDRCRAILTNHNGLVSAHRHCNNMGFLTDSPLPVCGELLKFYLGSDQI